MYHKDQERVLINVSERSRKGMNEGKKSHTDQSNRKIKKGYK